MTAPALRQTPQAVALSVLRDSMAEAAERGWIGKEVGALLVRERLSAVGFRIQRHPGANQAAKASGRKRRERETTCI